MIVIVGGIKGGSGKSTIATNLTIMRAQSGADVLLVDADDQETSTDFTALRSERMAGPGAGYTSIRLSGAALRTETLKLAAKYDDVIIDAGGRDTTSQRAALAVADVLLVPFVPRSFDVWTIAQISAIVCETKEAINPKLDAYAFLNRADSRGGDNNDAAGELQRGDELKYLNVTIGNRKSFANAAAAGLAVTELRPLDRKAVDETTSLYSYVFEYLTAIRSQRLGVRRSQEAA